MSIIRQLHSVHLVVNYSGSQTHSAKTPGALEGSVLYMPRKLKLQMAEPAIAKHDLRMTPEVSIQPKK